MINCPTKRTTAEWREMGSYISSVYLCIVYFDSQSEFQIVVTLLDVLLVKQNAFYPSNSLVNTPINIRPNDEHLVREQNKKPFCDCFHDVRTVMSF